MIIFTLAVNFIVGLGIYGAAPEYGFDVDVQDPDSAFADLTTLTDGQGAVGIDALWAVIGGSVAGLGVGVVLGWAFHSTALIGISLFSGVFWSSYVSAFNTIESLGLLSGFAQMSIFFGILSLGMFFIFASAVIGMLSGSG